MLRDPHDAEFLALIQLSGFREFRGNRNTTAIAKGVRESVNNLPQWTRPNVFCCDVFCRANRPGKDMSIGGLRPELMPAAAVFVRPEKHNSISKHCIEKADQHFDDSLLLLLN
jgi:hypothetical protein